jgi:hypothetical protein
MVSAAATIAAAEPSRTPIISLPEIFILRLLSLVTKDWDPQRDARPLPPLFARLETSRFYSRPFILFLFLGRFVARVLIVVSTEVLFAAIHFVKIYAVKHGYMRSSIRMMP